MKITMRNEIAVCPNDRSMVAVPAAIHRKRRMPAAHSVCSGRIKGLEAWSRCLSTRGLLLCQGWLCRRQQKFSAFRLESHGGIVEFFGPRRWGAVFCTIVMKRIFWFLPLAAAFLSQAHAQTRSDFQIIRITKNLISTPQFTYSGAEQFQTNQRERWLEVEVEFAAAPEWTDELTFRYFILYNGRLLTGEVTHTNVEAGRGNRSVMYVSPRTLARFGSNQTVTAASFQNIAVQIVQQGAVKDEQSLARAPAQWFSTMPQVTGFVLNKNETPFASLYWDRYEQIKAAR